MNKELLKQAVLRALFLDTYQIDGDPDEDAFTLLEHERLADDVINIYQLLEKEAI